MINFDEYTEVKRKVVDAGRYEVVLSASVSDIKNPKPGGPTDYLNLSFKIRDDVNQKFNDGRCYVFKRLFRDKTNPQWFDLPQSGAILATQKGKENYKTKFDEVDEFVQYINGITLAVDVEKVMDDYYNEEVNQINFVAWKSPYHASEAGEYKPATPETKSTETTNDSGVKSGNTEKLELGENKVDDLPF